MYESVFTILAIYTVYVWYFPPTSSERLGRNEGTSRLSDTIEAWAFAIVFPAAAECIASVWLLNIPWLDAVAFLNISGGAIGGFFEALATNPVSGSLCCTTLTSVASDINASFLAAYTSWAGMVLLAANIACEKGSLLDGLLYMAACIGAGVVAHLTGRCAADLLKDALGTKQKGSQTEDRAVRLSRRFVLVLAGSFVAITYDAVKSETQDYTSESALITDESNDYNKDTHQLILGMICSASGAMAGNVLSDFFNGQAERLQRRSNLRYITVVPAGTLACNTVFAALSLALPLATLRWAGFERSLPLQAWSGSFCGAASAFDGICSDTYAAWRKTSKVSAALRNVMFNLVGATVVMVVAWEVNRLTANTNHIDMNADGVVSAREVMGAYRRGAEVFREARELSSAEGITLTSADNDFIADYVAQECDKIRDDLVHLNSLVSKNSQREEAILTRMEALFSEVQKVIYDAESLKKRIEDSGDCEATKIELRSNIGIMAAHIDKVTFLSRSAKDFANSARSCAAKRDLDSMLSSELAISEIQPLVKDIAIQSANQLNHENCISKSDVINQVERELNTDAHYYVGMHDFALDKNSASVVHDPRFTSAVYNPTAEAGGPLLSTMEKVYASGYEFVFGQSYVGGPDEAINSKVEVGDCFAFPGSKGLLTVKLAEPINVHAITIQHLDRSIAQAAMSYSSAPRHFKVWGYADDAALHENRRFLLLEDEYKLNGPDAIQSFYGMEYMALSQVVSIVTLEVFNNFDHEAFTCVYRFRVHGASK